MAWVVRALGDNEVYHPRETPSYANAPGYFTIKIHHSGEMRCYPHVYIGGTIRYVDNCDGDTLSMFEIDEMLDDCGDICKEDSQLFYKSPNVEMESGLLPLEMDDDVLRMCKVVPPSRIMNIYVVKKRPCSQESQDILPSADPNYVFIENDPVRIEWERRQEESLLLFQGLFPDFPDLVDDQNEVAGAENIEAQNEKERAANSDGDKASFHGDSSNVDSTDNEVVDVVLDKTAPKSPVCVPVDDDDESVSDVSVYAGSEDERMAPNSTDEDEACYPVFNEATDMSNPQFELSLLFSSGVTFREAVKKYSILNRRAIKRVHTGGVRAKYICEGEGCKWYIYASPMQNSQTYQVKGYYSKHRCNPTFKNSLITSTWIANQYENDIRMNPTWPLASFHKKVVNDWKCDVSIYSIGKAKRTALENINGKHADQYGLMCAYATELRKVMPDSTIELLLDELEAGKTRRRFKRIYICMGPIKKGFVSGCRPLIGLDGCHLKGPFGGQLLAAVGCDGNDGMYPIAWAVVEAENSETWNWFVQYLATDVGIENSYGWTFISDRKKGLINALQNVVPNTEHRFCVMHLYRNMWKDHKGLGLRKCLWLAAGMLWRSLSSTVQQMRLQKL